MTTFADPFTRADTAVGAGLGSIPSGPAWVQTAGSWRILSNKAHSDTAPASNPIATVDLALADLTELLVDVSSGGGDALYFRVVDSANWWRFRVEHIQAETPYYTSEPQVYCQTAGPPPASGYYWGSCPAGWTYLGPTGTTRQVYAGSTFSHIYRVILDKCVAGVVTEKAAATVTSGLDGLKVSMSGSTITPSYRISAGSWTAMPAVVDSAHNTATKHGLGRAASPQTGTGLDNFSATTANSPPNAPPLVSPVGGTVIDRSIVQRLRHLFSDPDGGDTQSALAHRYRPVGGGAWTTVTQTTPNNYRDYAAGTFPLGDIEWQAATRDAAGTPVLDADLVWSASGFFTAADPADMPTITSPINGGTIGAEEEAVTWSSDPYTHYQVRTVADLAGVPDTGTVYYNSGEVAFTGVSSHVATFDTNGRAEHVQVRVKIGGLWSSWASVQIITDYTQPALPMLAFSAADGRITVFANNVAPTGTEPEVSGNELWRRLTGDTNAGIRIATGVVAGGTFTDWFVASGVDYEYRWKAIGVNGTSRFGPWSSDDTDLGLLTFDDVAAAFATYDALSAAYTTFDEITAGG